MAYVDTVTQFGRLRPALEPQRRGVAMIEGEPYYAFPGQGTARGSDVEMNPVVSLWNKRFHAWRNGFEEQIGPNARKYWQLYRAFETGIMPGPQNSWRDRTVIPTCFNIIETRVPRIVMSMLGQREWFHVEGVDPDDESYEEMIRELIRTAYSQIGRDNPDSGDFFRRMIDAVRYREIMGHVFVKQWWRREFDWINTKIKDPETGKWSPIQTLDEVYNNIDVTWLSLDRVAIDLTGANRWTIERVETSFEALEQENENYRRAYDEDLYPNLQRIKVLNSAMVEDSYEEPRDTENWPLMSEQSYLDPGENRVELWLCWDNARRTLTKIANRRLILDDGMAPTPNGRAPIFGSPSVPVPNRIYGDSYLHWSGPLAAYQTRVARGRADEIILNLFQQYMFRQGTVANTDMFWVPGGSIAIEGEMNPDRPISDHVQIFPRRPVFQEAWQEEAYREKQARDTANADPLMGGNEATAKSRDVSAHEVNQRTQHGLTKDNTELMYNTSTILRPLVSMTFSLLKQNLTQPRMLRVLGEMVQADLQSIREGTDIIFGSGLHEISRAEQEQDFREFIELSQSNEELKARTNPEGILKWFFTSKGRRGMMRQLVRSDEEVQRAMGAEAGALLGAGGGGGSLPALPGPGGPGVPPSAGGGGGSSGSAGGPGGGGPPSSVEYV